MVKIGFKYLSQEFDTNILNLDKQKVFFSYEYMNAFGKFKGDMPEVFSYITVKKNSDKEYEHVLKVWNTFHMKKMKHYHDLHLTLS